MANQELIDRLTEHRLLGDAPREELAWVAARGRLQTFLPGELLSTSSDRIDNLYFVLTGHLAIYVNRGTGRHKVLEWRSGGVSGVLPYSRMVSPPGDTVAEEPSEILNIHRSAFPEMIRNCPEITAKLVHVMLDRARQFTWSDLHDEKMASLGRLAAGLAHELNNPASALARGAKLFPERLVVSDEASRALGASRLSAPQLAAIDAFREMCLTMPPDRLLSPLEAADREDAITEWLEKHRMESSLADSLAETAVTLDTLESLAHALEGPALESVLRWVAAGCSARRLAAEMEQAALRIFDLVTAVKGFTHMDQASVAEAVDIGKGLAQTVTVLRAKARDKSASVQLSLEPDLPRVHGFGGELNQVWANLIDNAIEAVEASGRVEISAGQKAGRVVVRVVDDGPGVPPDLRERIFDPFFTTKPVGQGTGLGLDIARRIVRKHDGDIEVASQPGRTEFCVSLPATGPSAPETTR